MFEAYRERIDQRAAEFRFSTSQRYRNSWAAFCVNENVLIPRLDTKYLVDQVLGIISGMEPESPEALICVLVAAHRNFDCKSSSRCTRQAGGYQREGTEVARGEINDVLTGCFASAICSSLDGDEKVRPNRQQPTLHQVRNHRDAWTQR